jgi:hypothetical protein
MKNKIALFAAYAAFATTLSYFLVPSFFAAKALSALAFGALCTAMVCVGLSLEKLTWTNPTFNRAAAANVVVRLVVRFSIYWLLPALVVLLLASLVPALFHLEHGFVQALAVTYLPTFVAAMMDLWPVKQL